MPYKVEIINNEDKVFRQVFVNHRIGPKNRRIPTESNFQLRNGEKGLSVNWDKYMTVENNFILIALTKNLTKGTFQNHTAYKIFKFPVAFLRNIDLIEDVIHKPEFNGNPSPLGLPNNQSHSEVLYENDIEIFLKLSDYCNRNFEDSYCDFDVRSINHRITELKELLNNTPFHKK